MVGTPAHVYPPENCAMFQGLPVETKNKKTLVTQTGCPWASFTAAAAHGSSIDKLVSKQKRDQGLVKNTQAALKKKKSSPLTLLYARKRREKNTIENNKKVSPYIYIYICSRLRVTPAHVQNHRISAICCDPPHLDVSDTVVHRYQVAAPELQKHEREKKRKKRKEKRKKKKEKNGLSIGNDVALVTQDRKAGANRRMLGVPQDGRFWQSTGT